MDSAGFDVGDSRRFVHLLVANGQAMSYWCGFEKTAIGSINMTSNVAVMWRWAGADLSELAGTPAREMRNILADAIHNMLIEPDKYRALNPKNGWGDYASCLVYLLALAVMAGEVDPEDTFRANH